MNPTLGPADIERCKGEDRCCERDGAHCQSLSSSHPGTQKAATRIPSPTSLPIVFSIRFSANSCLVPQSDDGRIPELRLFHLSRSLLP
jgi:hypothetical protein